MGITHVEEKKTATPFSILYRESSLRKKPNRAWGEGRGRGRNEQFAGAGFNLLRIHFLDRFLVPYRCCAGGEGERERGREKKSGRKERKRHTGVWPVLFEGGEGYGGWRGGGETCGSSSK